MWFAIGILLILWIGSKILKAATHAGTGGYTEMTDERIEGLRQQGLLKERD